MTDAAVSISPTDIETLEQLYTFRERTEVFKFLDKHSFLIPVLLEAPEKIRHYFPESQLFLEVVPDREIIDYVLLVLSILTKLDPDDAIARQKQMELDWWLNSTTHEVRSQLITLLEYPDDF